MTHLQDAVRHALAKLPSTQRLCVSYSGGLDSTALLAVLRDLNHAELFAVHVHHGLSSHAEAWATHCRQVCATWAIPLVVLRVSVDIHASEGIEAAARRARYAALSEVLTADDVLLTAQHADDQAETVLLQLLRGAGVDGLAAMAASRAFANHAWLVRPWLGVRRAEILAYAQQQGLTWVEDESNENERFSRNFLRQRILPELQQHWPQGVATLNRAAGQQAEASALLAELAAVDLSTLQTPGVRRRYTTQPHTIDDARFPALKIAELNQLNEPRRRNALRLWIRQQGARTPPASQLFEYVRQLAQAGQGELLWAEARLCCYRDLLYCLPCAPSFPPQSSPILPLNATASANLDSLLPEDTLSGHLQVYQGGGGLSVPPAQLTVKLRQQGGQLFWRGHHHTVKKLLQSAGIPPWLRRVLPLIYYGDELVAVPGIGCDPRFQSPENEVGWHFAWQM